MADMETRRLLINIRKEIVSLHQDMITIMGKTHEDLLTHIDKHMHDVKERLRYMNDSLRHSKP